MLHIYSIAVARHALTQKSKGQRPRSHCYEKRHGRTVASDHAWPVLRIPNTNTPLCYLRPFPAWVCMSIRLPMLPSYYYYYFCRRLYSCNVRPCVKNHRPAAVCACAKLRGLYFVIKGLKQLHIWNPRPRFAYSSKNFYGSTMMIKCLLFYL